MTATVAKICRYPVKGLSPESLERVTLKPGQALPDDRRFAIAHGSTRIDPAGPRWLPKTSFLMLMREEKLALLRVAFEPESGMLTLLRDGKPVVRAKATEPLGRTLIGEFFAGFLGDAARGVPRLLEAADQIFSDSPQPCVSVINLASVRDLERVVRQPVNPIRFRANFYLERAPAWAESDWLGRELQIGSARLRVDRPIKRCAATNVDPETAERDMNVPLALQRGFGHTVMGVYAEVVGGGTVARDDPVRLLS